MTGMLPIIEILEDCESDAERARWLLQVPSFVFYRNHTDICRVLRNAGFLKGVDLADLEFSLLVAKRGPDGEPPATAVTVVNAMRAFMRSLVRKGGLQ
ncbi:hypothetical protein [Agrobacterium larrymoorei]|uniref:Uncharacterized protein n=1 Tax=Agrobacterium larrymoorei TaxID=160699 RepID=A0AAF0KDE7_9HYPH|nr:hypothetical protein [Agrobacterium larrymoorei]WHA40933.1 hypothetical protein CFBP5477_014150 [Agrobacterium larrymoorei]